MGDNKVLSGALLRLSELAAMSEGKDKAASSHWTNSNRLFNFEFGNVRNLPVIGYRIPRVGRFGYARHFLHWLLQSPVRRLGYRYSGFPQILRLSRAIADRRGDIVDDQILRHANTLALLQQSASSALEKDYVAVIGDGSGVMTSLLLAANPKTKVILINLTRTFLVDLILQKQCVPDVEPLLVETEEEAEQAIESNKRLVAIQAHDARLVSKFPLSLAVNIASMQEMDMSAIDGYFDVLRSNPCDETLFYCANREEKVLPDKSIIRYDDYPWHEKDEIMFEGQVPWMKFVYSTQTC